MSDDYSNITILGAGLLGGSLAMNLAAKGRRVRLWARRVETVRAAHQAGIAGATADLAKAVADADLIVLAVPVGAMPTLVSQALAAGLKPGCMITDVGSVKAAPHSQIPPLLAGSGVDFIGSHPMAGSERNGLDAAAADLFQDAACLLTNDEQVAAPRAAALERFWQGVGCRTTWLSAAAHDALVARISHLPHIVAAGAARVSLNNPDDGRFGGGGLRDTIRIAGGDPGMWAEILTANRAALMDPLGETLSDLGTLLAYLEKGDQPAIRQWLATAKDLRDAANPQTGS